MARGLREILEDIYKVATTCEPTIPILIVNGLSVSGHQESGECEPSIRLLTAMLYVDKGQLMKTSKKCVEELVACQNRAPDCFMDVPESPYLDAIARLQELGEEAQKLEDSTAWFVVYETLDGSGAQFDYHVFTNDLLFDDILDPNSSTGGKIETLPAFNVALYLAKHRYNIAEAAKNFLDENVVSPERADYLLFKEYI